MISLPSLLARIESATGPDRELDCIVARVFGFDRRDVHARPYAAAYDKYGADEMAIVAASWQVPIYTASLDAAIALCERVLPGWTAGVNTPDPELDNVCVVEIWRGNANRAPMQRVYAEAPTPALALCAAIIKARMET